MVPAGEWLFPSRGEANVTRNRAQSSLTRDGSPNTLLVDTCVLVDHLRGFEPARDWLSRTAPSMDVRLTYSVITLAELLAGLTAESSRGSVEELLGLFEPVTVTETAARRAGGYMRQWRQSHGMAMPDALIAASARENGATLVTRDKAHFPMTDIAVVIPY